MSVFRVEKNKNYTVMSNYHLKDKNLSLKTKGLLSIMLSLPEEWDYTEIGLTKITGEGRSAIRSCLQQMEEFGYLVRSQSSDARGRFSKSVYIIYESPELNEHSPLSDFPTTDNPTSEKQISENTTTDYPTTGVRMSDNQTQLNKDKSNTDSLNTNPSIHPSSENDGSADGQIGQKGSAENYRACEDLIRENVSYDLFQYKNGMIESKFERDEIDMDEYEMSILEYDIPKLDDIIRYMTDFLTSASKEPVEVNGDLIPRDIVKSKLMKIGYADMKEVVKKMKISQHSIKNPKKYAISMLYNI